MGVTSAEPREEELEMPEDPAVQAAPASCPPTPARVLSLPEARLGSSLRPLFGPASGSLAGMGTSWNTEESAEIIFLPSGVGKIGGHLCRPVFNEGSLRPARQPQPCCCLTPCVRSSVPGTEGCTPALGSPCYSALAPRLRTLGKGLSCSPLCPSARSEGFPNSHVRRQEGGGFPFYR